MQMKITAMAHGSNGWGYAITAQAHRRVGPKIACKIYAFDAYLAFDKLMQWLITSAYYFQEMAADEGLTGADLLDFQGLTNMEII